MKQSEDHDIEIQEWLRSFEWIMEHESNERAREILQILNDQLSRKDGYSATVFSTPYVNSLPSIDPADYPGDLEIEKRLTAIIRWNALAMVVSANKKNKGIGGHISTYGSAADLFEVGFHHFFKGKGDGNGDMVYFQGHACPGVYARSFVERRFDEADLEHFRLEVQSEKGLSSYPHPRLMADYWEFPTVSMGLSAIQAIYQARFSKYLEHRGLKTTSKQHVWAFLGDGEMDEPESIGAITVAAREKLDNLIFVINCNLQRLDGPVRGNGKIIQELEALFTGAGWKVIKVLWGSEWDELFEKDIEGLLQKILKETPDGQFQKYAASDGKYIREHLFGQHEELASLVADLSDEQIRGLRPGGHDPLKIYAAYKAAVENTSGPTVILAQTIKGYGQGAAGEASNVAHQQKILDEEQLKYFSDSFDVPVDEEQIKEVAFYRPKEDSDEYKYLINQRENLGGFLPSRIPGKTKLSMPDSAVFEKFFEGSGDREAATTIVAIQLLGALMKDNEIGKYIVPIIPDESRTFGLDALFSQFGIYSTLGQNYEPVDKENLLYYKELKEGVIMEEGITEAGSISSFIAAGTAYANHDIPVIPVFFFYSMFGLQRIGDLVWAAADARAKGFLIGGISGRTSLSGEGLQHCDGQSHLYAMAYPNIKAYDPAFAYEMAVIFREGIRRMYIEGRDWIYYITMMNTPYLMPPKPDEHGVDEGIMNGMYRFSKSKKSSEQLVHLLGSGAIMTEVIAAARILEEQFQIAVDVWSVTSYKQLYDNAIRAERANRLPGKSFRMVSHIEHCVGREAGIFIAASDYLKALPLTVARWFPGTFIAMGTDGFGRSDTVPALRDFFEVDANHIAFAALSAVVDQGVLSAEELAKAAEALHINTERLYDPADPL